MKMIKRNYVEKLYPMLATVKVNRKDDVYV
jgi:hypothetical protein